MKIVRRTRIGIIRKRIVKDTWPRNLTLDKIMTSEALKPSSRVKGDEFDQSNETE